MTDEDIDPKQFDLDGRGENNEGLAIDFNTVGSTPSLRVYVGPYGKSLDSPEEAKAFLANLEDKVEAYVQAMDGDLSVD